MDGCTQNPAEWLMAWAVGQELGRHVTRWLGKRKSWKYVYKWINGTGYKIGGSLYLKLMHRAHLPYQRH